MGTRTVYFRKVSGGNVCRAIGVGAMVLGGCGTALGPEDANGPRPTLSLSALDLDDDSTYYETSTIPNNLFELAEYVEIAEKPRLIRGSISAADDVDVYDLGPVVPGDRILVTMTTTDPLEGAIALFDDAGTALLVNDHRNVYLGKTEPFIDVTIRREAEAYFVAVAATPGYAATGDYSLVATREFPVELPDPRSDVVLLVFDGGEDVVIGGRLPVDIPPFDAASISPSYAGQTDLLVSEIVDQIRNDYAGFDLTILSTSEGDRPEPGMTRIFFGTYDSALLGVADGVDEFNATKGQVAIVFADTFAAFNQLSPTMSEMAQAMANVASHEIGHLMGMVHTADPAGVMDVTASLNQLLQDQALSRSPVYSAVFPLGYQDAVQYLLDAVGGDPNLMASKWLRGDRRALSRQRTPSQLSARTTLRLSSCCLH